MSKRKAKEMFAADVPPTHLWRLRYLCSKRGLYTTRYFDSKESLNTFRDSKSMNGATDIKTGIYSVVSREYERLS